MKEANRDAMGMLQQDEDFDAKMKAMEEQIKREQELKEIELNAAKEALEAERTKQLAELKA